MEAKIVKFTLPAHGKINTRLKILGREVTGYHQLFTSFHYIDLCDYLEFKFGKAIKVNATIDDTDIISFSCNDPLFNSESNRSNLVVKAAIALLKYVEIGKLIHQVHIHLIKNIPVGAGLGGGSSDAATTLLCLNHLWNLNLSRTKLEQIALQLGADVPFFVHGTSCYATGRGEIWLNAKEFEGFESSFEMPDNLQANLILPGLHVSTQQIFTHPNLSSKYLIGDHVTYEDSSKYISQNLATLLTGEENDLTSIVCSLYPSFEKLIKATNFVMSGSGSSIFLIQHHQYSVFESEIKSQFPDLKLINITILRDNPLENILKNKFHL